MAVVKYGMSYHQSMLTLGQFGFSLSLVRPRALTLALTKVVMNFGS